MILDYFYGQAGELFSFYRIPKALFQEPRFQSLSTDAKTLYGILLDRMSLSVKNGWLDEQNRVFIIFTIEDVKRALCCADNKATKLLRELKEFGLIERKRRGLGKPSLVYPQQTIHLLRCILIAAVLVMHQNVVGFLDLFRLLFQLAVNPAVNLPVIINQAVLL